MGPDRGDRGRLIAFEGVDGAGKTTALARVAARLRNRGIAVCMPRTGKEHSSRPARMIRRLTRDRRNLDLTARGELLLYCAREAQVLQELVAPALRRGQTVLVDRSLLTAEVLGRARGLPAQDCQQALATAENGLSPDLTLVFDVHPCTSRLRKRIERIRGHGLHEEGSRKGLAGSAFKKRVRYYYLLLAAERGYPLIHAERATPEEVEARVLRLLDHGPEADLGQTEQDRIPEWLLSEDVPLDEALLHISLPAALVFSRGLVAGRALRRSHAAFEPQLAAFGLDPEDPLREALAEAEPEYTLRSQRRRPLAGPADLRLRLLHQAPTAVIENLRYLHQPAADVLRERFAPVVPAAVLASLAGREDPFAERLRDQCWDRGTEQARAASLEYCRSSRAWGRREELLSENPVLALNTLRGLSGEQVDAWLVRYARTAPKRVLRVLGGRTDPLAYELRYLLFETGREVIDSVRGQDDPEAWLLREQALTAWPCAVARSLLGLPATPRVAAMAARCRQRAGGDLHLLRRLQELVEWPARPLWARSRHLERCLAPLALVAPRA